MKTPENMLKRNLLAGLPQLGMWLDLGSAAVAEMAARAGFDWVLIDAEHGPNTITAIQNQLYAIAGHQAAAVVRVPAHDEWMLKHVLDIGVQTVMVPMVNTAAQAADIASSMLYTPKGRRGLGAGVARASGYGANADYVQTANAQTCIIVQIETVEAVENIEEIAAVDGIDCLFIGPADLSADMGHAKQMDHPDVRAMIDRAMQKIHACGKASGIITLNAEDQHRFLQNGMQFIGIAADGMLMQRAMQGVLKQHRNI